MQDTLSAKCRAKRGNVTKKCTRRMVDVTFNPTEIQSSQDLYVKVQTLPMKHVMVPDSRRLTYTFENGNTDSYHLNKFESTIFN